MDVVVLFPGQGSQKPGMGKDVAEQYPEARAVFASADGALGDALSALCFDGPAETLTLTHNAQPALLTHGAAVWAVVRARLAPHVRAVAGHSLGEFSAYHAAGSLTLGNAVRLVRQRGTLMHDAGVARPGTMAAVLGDTHPPLEEICATASIEAGTVVVANYNCPGQLVISGAVAGVDRAMELAKAAGAKRVIKLNVAGAFHSPLMEPAEAGLVEALGAASWVDPTYPVYANVNAEPVTTAATARAALREQLAKPVRWTQEISAIAARYSDALYVEMGPGNVLSGLVKKIVAGARTMTCGTAAEVAQLLELVA